MRRSLPGTLVIVGISGALALSASAQDTMNPRAPAPAAPVAPPATSPPPAMPASLSVSKVAPPPSLAKTSLELRGQVSDVWDAEVRSEDKENKVVLVETDQGQIVLADLGSSETVKVEEGTAATVTGGMVNVEGTQRFVPETVKVGTKASGPAPANQQVKSAELAPVKKPQKARITGKVVDKEKMNAKQSRVDHELAVIEVAPGSRMLVDLGPAEQLKAVELDEGDQLNVEGQKIQVNESFMLVAEKIQKGDKKVRIQRTAMPKKANLKTQGLEPIPVDAPVKSRAQPLDD